MSLARYLSKLGAMLGSDGKVPQAALAANVAGNGPAFSVFKISTNAQTLTNAVDTKIRFDTEVFDTNNKFDSATNYRFQPDVAGYYFASCNITYGAASGGIRKASIWLNGAEYQTSIYPPIPADWSSAHTSAIVYLNGTTDYLEFYGEQTSGGNLNVVGYGAWTKATAALVRAA